MEIERKKPTSEVLHEDTLLRLVKTKAHNGIRIELLESALFSVGAYSVLSLSVHTPHKR